MRRSSALAAAIFLLGVAAPVGAQTIPLPPLPPLPPEASLVLEYVAPVVSPVCGNAGFAVLIVQGTTATLPLVVDLPTLFGPAFVVCGAVPTPENQLTCSFDDQTQALLDQAFGAALGSTSLISGRLVGPLVEQVVVVQDALPPPLNTAGLAPLAIGTLECRVETPETEAPPPVLPGNDTVPAPSDFDTGSVPAATFDLGPAPTTVDDLAAAPSLVRPPTRLVQPAPVAAIIGGRELSWFVYLVPVIAAGLCILLARGLLAELD